MAKKIAICVERLMTIHGLGQRDAQAIFDEVVKRRDKWVREISDDDLAKKLTEMAIDDLDEAKRRQLNNRRARLLGVIKTKEVQGIIQKFTESGMSYKQAWHTFLLGGANQTAGALNSVAQTRFGLERLFTGKFAPWARENKEILKALKKPQTAPAMERRLADALINKKYEGDAVNELARLMAESLEGFRVAANDAGLDIGRMGEGYLPHRHDKQKISEGRFENFYKVVMETADLERTYPGSNNLRESILNTYEAILGNNNEFFEGANLLGTRKGSSLEKHREIHFKGAEGWTKYAAEFGRGGVWDSVMNYLDSGVRQLALIQRLGPRPEDTIARIIDGMKVVDGASEQFKSRNSSYNFKRRDGDVGGFYRVVSGEDLAPNSLSLAKLGSFVRSAQSLAKLGGAALSSITDLPVVVMRLKTNHGVSVIEGYHQTLARFFEKIPPEKRTELGYVFDAICEGIQGDMAQRFDLENPMSGKMNDAMRLFFKINGLTPYTDMMKTGVYMGISSNIGFHSKSKFANLPIELQSTLKMYDLEDYWDVMRINMVRKVGNKDYLVADLARELDDDLIDQMTASKWKNVSESLSKEDYSTYAATNAVRAYNFLPLEMQSFLAKHGLGDRWDIIRKHLVGTDADGVKFIIPESVKDIPDEVIDNFMQAKWENMESAIGLKNSTATKEGLVELQDKLRKDFRSGLQNDLERSFAESVTLKERKIYRESLRRQYREKIEADIAGFLSSEVNKAVLTPDERNRYALLRGTKPGTAAGELFRSVTQFKSFPILFIQQVLMPIWASRKVEGKGLSGALSTMGLTIAQCTLFGAVAMEAKRLARGEKPYALSENPDWVSAFSAAFAQGGGLGIYGDFVLGEFNRFGQSFLESLAGPGLGMLNDVLKLYGKTRTRAAYAAGLSDDPGLRAADIVRFGKNNAPGLNLFYARLALDWAILWDLEELVSPGFQARRVSNARRDGREHWLSPQDDRLRPFTD